MLLKNQPLFCIEIHHVRYSKYSITCNRPEFLLREIDIQAKDI